MPLLSKGIFGLLMSKTLGLKVKVGLGCMSLGLISRLGIVTKAAQYEKNL